MANIIRLAIIGSTGSIGKQTLEVIRALPERFQVVALAAGSNLKLLAEQIDEFKPRFTCFQGDSSWLSRRQCEYISLEKIAALADADMVVIAVPGIAGLMPTLTAVKAGKIIALANKESLVSAGAIIMAEADKSGAQIRPVDSEHSAIWQCLEGEKNKLRKIILTASGGPFRSYSQTELADVTAEQALRHPSWHMGQKVTIDSATLMNKGLEVIEAHWLFSMPFEQIEVVVHPQSIIHSMVEFGDGAIKAQLGAPDMRLPIQYALSYPERLPNDTLPKLDLSKINRFDFEKPDYTRFPCLKLAIEAGKKGGTYPAVLCAADEVAVELFLNHQIKFIDIPALIEGVLGNHSGIMQPDIEAVRQADMWAREEILRAINRERMHC
jgi:1-deoxy-D-xylulose-5-phosphate reductoisomerase